MIWSWIGLIVAAAAAAAAAATLLPPPLAVGAALAVLATALILRMPLPAFTPVAELKPRNLLEGLWLVTWLWEGLAPGGTLVMRGALYYYSVFAVGFALIVAAITCVAYLVNRGHMLSGVPTVAKLLIVTAAVALIGIIMGPVAPVDGIAAPIGRVVSLSATCLSIVLLYKGIASPSRSLALAAQAFVIGVAISMLMLVASGGLQGGRFGIEAVLHPNTVGSLCGTGSLLLLGFWSRIGKWWLAPVLCILLFSLFLSMSKTSLLAAAIAMCVWAAMASPKQRVWRTIVLLLATLAVLLLAGSNLIDYLATYVQKSSGAATLSGRTQLWESTVRLWLDRPIFGYGYALYPDVVAELAPEISWTVGSVSHAHNALLTVLLEMGLLGAALLSTWVVGTASGLARMMRSGMRSPEVVTWMMLFVFLMARSFTEGSLAFRGDTTILLLVSLGLARWQSERAVNGRLSARTEETAGVAALRKRVAGPRLTSGSP